MRWLSSHKDAHPNTTKIQAVRLPTSTPEQNSRAATYIQFPSTSSSVSTDDMHGFSILGRFRRATPSNAHEQRVNSESRKPLRSILKPIPAPREPTPKPILAPRPRKASRTSPVENLEHLVSTRTPSRMHTPAQNPAIRPPGLRQDPSSGPQYQSQRQPFPMKPQEHVIPVEMMANSRAAFPTKPKPPRSSKQDMAFSGNEEQYAQPVLAHLSLSLKPPTSRPVTAIDTYQSDAQGFPEKPHHRSSHRHKSESKEERKERKRREGEQAGADPSKRHRHDSGRHRKDSGRHEDKHRDRELKRERSRSHREVMTDTEQWARQKPAPVASEPVERSEKIALAPDILPAEFHVPTRSGRTRRKLNIRFNVSRDPYHCIVERWNLHAREFVELSGEDYRALVSGDSPRVLTQMTFRLPSADTNLPYSTYLSDPRGLQVKHVYRCLWQAYSVPLSDEEKRRFQGIMCTREFVRWFDFRCNQSADPEAERRMGPRRVDMLQGNVFFGGLKYLGNSVWEVRFDRNYDNSMWNDD